MQPNYLLVFWRFPPGNASTKDSKLCVPGSHQVCQSFQFCGGVPGCWYYPTQSGMQKVSFGGGALIFPPGHPALALALFYQIWPCPCKCPNGHKNGICVCFYPKSAISCRDCPTNPPKSLCTPPTKSYKFVSANPCKTDAGRINKYDYTGCVGGSFWNFIRFRDFPEMVRDAKASHFGRGVCGADGEGKDAAKEPDTQRYAPCLSEPSYRNAAGVISPGLPSQALRASSPKGGASGEEALCISPIHTGIYYTDTTKWVGGNGICLW